MKFKVWCPELGSTIRQASIIDSIDEETAAMEWAEWYDSQAGEFSIARGEQVKVYVTRDEVPYILAFTVVGWLERTYSACPRKDLNGGS